MRKRNQLFRKARARGRDLWLPTSLDATKATGSDEISARMLKGTAASIAPVVTQLFNISLLMGKLPREWKHALITPVPKSNELSTVCNYRPISVLSILSEVLERHVHSLLLKHLCSNDPISNSQFGLEDLPQVL